MADAFNILGISGSLRKGSFNTMALRAAQKLLPQGATMDTAEIGNLPLYNDDVRAAGFPPAV
jgi:chromate reductase